MERTAADAPHEGAESHRRWWQGGARAGKRHAAVWVAEIDARPSSSRNGGGRCSACSSSAALAAWKSRLMRSARGTARSSSTHLASSTPPGPMILQNSASEISASVSGSGTHDGAHKCGIAMLMAIYEDNRKGFLEWVVNLE